ncbi:MAG TPA: choice-of-anchor L domain-containing protein [Chitinophagales bacterium]|nr:choice-of-anchor L domain-containing protein [Chitinophagales bacterium]
MKIQLQTLIVALFSCLFLLLKTQIATAQITVDGSYSDTDLAATLAGEGVVISNAYFVCGDPSTVSFGNCESGKSYGYFECDNCNLGLGSGVVLTTGCIDNAIGPNNLGSASTSIGSPGDPTLNTLITGTTNDACALFLDVEVAADTLKFNYVFGSEEYLEFVGTSFNDVFAFYISGPNPAGGNYNLQNIAIIPGTSTPVSINNVNNTSNTAYYVNNGTGTTAPNNANPFYIQYDGFTTVLEARAAVIPCQTYTLKLVIADVGDSSLDSGVFIEAGSLSTNKVTLSATTALASAGFINAVEGCVDGIINFNVDIAPNDTATVYFDITGTAINGVDYLTIPDSIQLFPGDTMYQLIISPFADGLLEGLESVKIRITNAGLCASGILDSIELFIQDNIIADAGPSPILTCPGSEVQLALSGGITCEWQPATYLSNPNDCFPIATPQASITYTGITRVGPCVDTTYVEFIMDDNANPQAPPEYATCSGNPVQLSASGGLFYMWTPATGLSCTNCPNPTFTGDTTTVFTVRIFDAVGCETQLPVTVNVTSSDLGLQPDTQTICLGDNTTLDLGLSGNFNYVWSPATGLSCTDCANPVVSVTDDITYSVTASIGACEQSTTRSIVVSKPQVSAGADVSGCETFIGTIGSAIQQGYTYQWTPTTGLSDATAAQPQINVSVQQAGVLTYTVTATDANGCVTTDAVSITLDYPRSLSIAQPDTIVEGSGTTIAVTGGLEGDTYNWQPSVYITEPNKASVFVRPSETTLFTATVTTPLGCESEASVMVYVIEPPRLLVPSSFSPNGDGVNDILRIVHRDITELLLFAVYNRWGQLVYSNEGSLNEGWNGKFKGEEQPVGVYVYYVEYKELGSNEVKVAKGNSTLIR